jgi:hypothetical protein
VKRIATALAITTLAIAGLPAAPAAPALTETPPGKVLVVSVNLYDTNGADASKTGDMRNFVDRVAKIVPFVPDVLLLQEVRHKSVAAVKKFMTNKTGNTYRIIVDAGRNPWKQITTTKLLGTDTAILMNADTMTQSGAEGYFKTTYKPGDAAAGSSLKFKKHAYAFVEERNGDLELPLVSIHYPKQREFASEATSQRLKKDWSRTIANGLAKKYPSSGINHTKVIAGDFNNFRCDSIVSGNCRETPLYGLLTGPTFKYKDSVHVMEVGQGNPIDFIFTTGNVVRANNDDGYNPSTNNSAVFYSNHQFRWSLIEGPDTTGPTDPGRITDSAGWAAKTRIRGWEKVRDGGTGFEHYEIWRSVTTNNNFQLRDTTTERIYEDTNVQRGEKYFYYVVAVDGVRNASQKTNTVNVTAGN